MSIHDSDELKNVVKKVGAVVPPNAAPALKLAVALDMKRQQESEDAARDARLAASSTQDEHFFAPAATPNELEQRQVGGFENTLAMTEEISGELAKAREEEAKQRRYVKFKLVGPLMRQHAQDLERSTPAPLHGSAMVFAVAGAALGASISYFRKEATLESAFRGSVVGLGAGVATSFVLQWVASRWHVVHVPERMPDYAVQGILKWAQGRKQELSQKHWTVVEDVWAECAREYNAQHPNIADKAGALLPLAAAAIAKVGK